MKTAYFDELIQDMKNGVYDFTKDGKCSNCGECCSDILPVSLEEIRTIRKYIKKHGIAEQKHFSPTAVVPTFDLTCPFRNNAERKCMIYEVRPAICREFQCDKPRKQIKMDRKKFHDLYMPISMRVTFFLSES